MICECTDTLQVPLHMLPMPNMSNQDMTGFPVQCVDDAIVAYAHPIHI
jgi:hypothetical protein